MKNRKVVRMVLLVFVLGLVSVSLMVGIHNYRAQASNARSEFFNDRGVQPETAVSSPKPTPKPGIASNPLVQMIHGMLGIPVPDDVTH